MATKEGLLAYQTKYPIHAAIRARDEHAAIEAIKHALQLGLSLSNMWDTSTDFENAYRINNRRFANVNPLFLAIDYKLNEVVKFLLDPVLEQDLYLVENYNEDSSESALHVAARIGSTSIVTMLVEAGCDINYVDSCCDTPLHFAAVRGNNSVVKKLIELGADKFQYNIFKETPFLNAAITNKFSTMKLCFDENFSELDISKALYWTAGYCNKDAALWLSEKLTTPNFLMTTRTFSSTLLHNLVKNTYFKKIPQAEIIDYIEFLSKIFSEKWIYQQINTMDSDNKTPLEVAADPEVATYLRTFSTAYELKQGILKAKSEILDDISAQVPRSKVKLDIL